MSDSLHPMDHSLPDSWTGLPMEFPGKSTGVCCHSLFQGIFWKLPGRLQSMGSQRVGHNLATNTSPGGSFQPRDQIHISCIGRWFIYHWASWEDWEQKSLSPVGLFATQALNSPGWKTGVGIPSVLQGIFPTQGSNSALLPCGRVLYQLSHKESPVEYWSG